MKYAFMSFSCPELGLEEMLSLAGRYGYDAVEPRVPTIRQMLSAWAATYSPRSKLMTAPFSQRVSDAKWVSASEPGATWDSNWGGTVQHWASTCLGLSDQPAMPSR